MLLCLSFMCSRLMESSQEIFAAILIQAAYRKYRNKVLLERKQAAAKVIIDFWRQFKVNYFRAQRRKYAGPVAVLEAFVLERKRQLLRLKLNRLQLERKMAAATKIQVSIMV